MRLRAPVSLGALLVASLLTVPFANSASAAPAEPTPDGVVDLGPANKKLIYLVQLDKAATPARRNVGASTWRGNLRREQRSVQNDITDALGHNPKVGQSWTDALNGFTVTLTGKQAQEVAGLPGVSAVTVDKVLRTTSTSNGADWIKADDLWTGTASGGVNAKGEGLVIGVIDSGINPANPSFAARVPVADGGDNYQHVNPRGAGNYVGMCDPDNATYVANWGCNDKLIGAYRFTSPHPDYVTTEAPYDDTGHGSHTASTAAGNLVRAKWAGTDVLPTSNTISDRDTGIASVISGVAPHANLISYDVCAVNTFQEDGCRQSDMVSAWNQAILDDVDVINFSIGGSTPTAVWSDPIAQAQLNARKAGISVAVSAGNRGSAAATISNYGDVPWVTSVANTSHDLASRPGSITFQTAAGASTALGTQPTETLSADTAGARPIVLAKDSLITTTGTTDDTLCLPDTLDPAKVIGKVVVCDRGSPLAGGTQSRINKGRVVKDAGGAGMILANNAQGQNQLRDVHVLPAAQLDYATGTQLKTVLASAPTTRAVITGGTFARDTARADIVNSSSSRGPSRNTNSIGPDLAAPGTDVLAAAGTNNETTWTAFTGTSMASPHVAGSIALLKQLHPTWTPAEIQSALMTTATTEVKDYDRTAANWFEMGAGRIDVAKAAGAGLLLDAAPASFDAADPSAGGILSSVNLPSITDSACSESCTVTRRVKATAAGVGKWTATVTSHNPALSLALSSSTVTLGSAGASRDVSVTATVSDQPYGTWVTGTLTLTPPNGSTAPVAHLPIAVSAATGKIAPGPKVSSHRSSGTHISANVTLPYAADRAAYSVTKPSIGTRSELQITPDRTPDAPFDVGSNVRTITVPEGTRGLAVTFDETTSQDMDLRIGTGNTPSAGTLQCISANDGSAESCTIADPAPGTWWISSQNYKPATPGKADRLVSTITLVSGNEADHLTLAPASPLVRRGASQPLNLTWDAPLTTPGTSGWSVIDVKHPGGTRTSSLVQVGQFAADVSVGDIPTTLTPGDTVTSTVTIQPDLTGENPVHTVTMTLPSSWSATSATAGGTVSGRKVTWTGTQAQLATRAGTPGDEATLNWTATVGHSAREGDEASLNVTAAISAPGSSSSATYARTAVVQGGTWPSGVLLRASPTTLVATGSSALTATVTGRALARPTGTVTFQVDGRSVGTSVVAGNGTATLKLTRPAAGKRSVRAVYSGDARNLAATSSAQSLTVNVVRKSVSITAKPQSKVRKSKAAKPLIVRVKSAGRTPRGKATITIKGAGRTVRKTVTISSSGTVKVSLGKYRKTGKVKVQVAYKGDATTLPRTWNGTFSVLR